MADLAELLEYAEQRVAGFTTGAKAAAPAAAAAPPPPPAPSGPPPIPICKGVLRGLRHAEDGINGAQCCVIGWRPARRRWLVAVGDAGGARLLVRREHLRRYHTARPPRGWGEDARGRTRPGAADGAVEGGVVELRDVDGDAILFELAGGREVRYAVNGKSRPPACSGDKGWQKGR
eukprot:gene5614-9700_t